MTLPRLLPCVVMQVEPSPMGAPFVEYTAVNTQQRIEVTFTGQTSEFQVYQKVAVMVDRWSPDYDDMYAVQFEKEGEEPQQPSQDEPEQQQWKWEDNNLGTDSTGAVILPPEAVTHEEGEDVGE